MRRSTYLRDDREDPQDRINQISSRNAIISSSSLPVNNRIQPEHGTLESMGNRSRIQW
jgi:hypothetical protein